MLAMIDAKAYPIQCGYIGSELVCDDDARWRNGGLEEFRHEPARSVVGKRAAEFVRPLGAPYHSSPQFRAPRAFPRPCEGSGETGNREPDGVAYDFRGKAVTATEGMTNSRHVPP
jgi:hypothetical protein